MAVFQNLSEKINHVFSKLSNRGALTELEIKQAMREVRVALLEADVNFTVAKDFINKTGFVPDGVCALMCHSDFFHQHRGMDEEYVLSPDNCSYNATPRNPERERQAWTNYA